MQNFQESHGFRDLNVYKTLMDAMALVHSEVLPKLPETEKFSLSDQLRRSSGAPPALLAEGYAKRKHHKSWLKYLEDAIGECNESIAHLDKALRLYPRLVPKNACLQAIDLFDKASRQMHKLGQSWEQK